jgi:hypothetical protein
MNQLGRFATGLACLVLLCAGSPSQGDEPKFDEAQLEYFEKKIRPLLVENCHACHSSGKKQKAHLFLDSRAGLLRGGDSGPAVVPGAPEKSLLVKAVGYQDADLRMPPRSKLADAQVADLIAWVRMGAPWPTAAAPHAAAAPKDFNLQERRRHWSFQPLMAPAPPAVRRRDWPRSPVDAFVLAGLEAAGLAPAPPADKRTLLRRLTYDLIGLPPSPAEIEAFLADEAPDAYEKVVERLLDSPHYGERWGRHWLDLVRFAETAGHEYDFDLPDAWRYRDYVIRALNEDVPYDQFVREHVAGDLLPQPRRHPTEHTNESILATGFWLLGEAAHSPVDVRADEADRIDNQIDVFGKAFLGLTVACARCHDHKFDAISTRDYYALAGYLESSRCQRAFLDPPERTTEAAGRLAQVQAEARPLAGALTAPGLRDQVDRLIGQLLAGTVRPAATDPLFAAWTALVEPRPETTPEQFAKRRTDLLRRLQEQRARAADAEAAGVVFADFRKDTYRDWFVTGDAFGTGPTRAPEVVLRTEQLVPLAEFVPAGVAHSGLVSGKLQGALRSRTFVLDKKKIWYRVWGRQTQINLIIDGYQLIRDPIYGGLTIHVKSDRPVWRNMDVGMWLGHKAYVEVLDDGPGHVALEGIVLGDDGPPPEAPNPLLVHLLDDPGLASAAALARKYQDLFREILGQWQDGTLGTARDAADRIAFLNDLLHSGLLRAQSRPPAEPEPADRTPLASMLAEVRRLEAALPPPRRALALADGTAWNERVHIRGSHKNLGETAPRRLLEAIAGADQPAPAQGSGRLELAERLLEPANALLPRVLVNRLWQHHFGEGIVRSPDNFGVLGERPTHPELLDYLATEFVRRGWSIKAMHRLLVLSRTYRMASRGDPAADEKDPQNKLLHRMPVRRLEAEGVRDAILAVSGRLDRRMYGPGVPPHLTPFMAGRGRPSQSGPLDGGGRRTVYLSIRRNFLPPLLLAFDYPVPFTTMGRRSVSNVPAQALTLLNNPFVVEQAETWARRVSAESGLSAEQRVTGLYVTAFGRPPTAEERAAALDFLAQQAQQYGSPSDRRAWGDLCHVLLNVKEFLFIH